MPANMPIMCMVDGCGITCKGDSAYLQHMQTVHGTTSPDQAIGKQKAIQNNIPKDIAAIALDKDSPPSDEFMKLAQMMDQPQATISPPVEIATKPARTIMQEEKKPKDLQPLKLTYKWEGQCSTCGNTVKTIIVRDTAVAWCLHCDEQKQEQEVEPLYKAKINLDPIEERILARRKERSINKNKKNE